MTSSSAASSAHSFAPLAPLLRAVPPEKLDEAQRRAAGLGREELIERFRIAFSDGKRLVAFVLADELIARGMPPCFWHLRLTWDEATVNQRFSLLVYDLRWMRRRYADHARVVRYQRCKTLLIGSDTMFHNEAEFMFYAGKRPAWKIVGSLSMTERQQWDCAWLRSAPIKKRAGVTDAMSDRVLKALQDDLRTVRRTLAFGEAEADATLLRRHALWRCARMVDDASPAETAVRYSQMTGSPITRQVAAKQLDKVRSVVGKS